MLTIQETMNSFLNLIKNKEEGGHFSRFKSWEYCHQIFNEYHNRRNTLTDNDLDYLALHLSFYLASWGMYRGSSFILQRDYKAHIKIVKRVLKPKYDSLWKFDPSDKSDDELKDAAKLAKEAYDDIEDAYGIIPERYFADDELDTPISITLITKILMGTFALSPALDRFFKDGIKLYVNNSGHDDVLGAFSHYDSGKYFKEIIYNLFVFAKNHYDELNCSDDVTSFEYPLMKKVDMYFWEVGYELGFYNALKEKEQKLGNSANFADKKAKKSYEKLIGQIKTIFPEYEINCENNLETIRSLKTHLSSRF